MTTLALCALLGFIIGCIMAVHGADVKLRRQVKNGVIFVDDKIYMLREIKQNETK